MTLPPLPSFQLIAAAGMLATVAGVLGHYVVFGPHRIGPEPVRKPVRRFSLVERFLHDITLLSFVTLGVTGMIAAVGQGARISGWLWVTHAIAAPVFIAALLLIVAMWAKDGRFASYDFKWFLFMGGYLGIGRNKHLQAGRFNAGQKMYLWMVAALGLIVILSGLARMFPVLGDPGDLYVYYVHRYSTLLIIMAVIGHAYLGTLANPGTFWTLITGKVTENWAKHHHPVWWEEMNTTSKDASKSKDA